MAVVQITSDRIYSVSYKYSDDDVNISDIQYFDTLYHISNVNVSDEYIRTQLFSDSLHPSSPLPCQVRQLGLHHPAGALGKKLLVKVKDLMHSGEDNASVAIGTTLHKAIVEMSNKGLSMVNIVDADNMLKGIITDGDLRRMLDRKVDVYTETVDHLMTKTPTTVDYRDMAINALQTMSDKKITCMPVLNEGGKVVGTIMMQDIFKAGIVR